MKKFVVLLVVVAMTLVTSAVFAAEVTVGGELAVRARSFDNMDLDDDNTDTNATAHRDTQSRYKIDINAKAGDVRGKLQVWNDFETWGGLEAQNGGAIGVREAWISLPLPGVPVTVTAGHQLLTIGNGWFFRSQHFGSDAWVISNTTGPNSLAFVNVKVSEGATAAGDISASDDVDAYALIDVFKLTDTMAVGADVTMVRDRRGLASLGGVAARADLINLGLNFNGKVGPVALKAQVDLQAGEYDDGGPDFAGNQIVAQASMPVGPVGINVTLGMGSGDDDPAAGDIDQFINFLDIDPHYTFLYEYKMANPDGDKNFGFSNTTALGVGATFAATNSLSVGADFWLLKATETPVGVDDEIGSEVDVKVNWKVADNVTWNWVAGVFMAGDAWGTDADDATGVQGILNFKF